MRTLYHFQMSPYSRRARLGLAHKGLEVELRDARENPALREEAQQLGSCRTIPVLVDGANVIGDSTAILHWLDLAYPKAPRLWPEGDGAAAALNVASLVDVVLGHVVDLGTRYYALREHPSWSTVHGEMLGRAQLAADGLAKRVASLAGKTVAPGGWSAGDIALLTLVLWIEGWPSRAATNPNIAQVQSLGFRLPPELSRWADAHRGRADVAAL